MLASEFDVNTTTGNLGGYGDRCRLTRTLEDLWRLLLVAHGEQLETDIVGSAIAHGRVAALSIGDRMSAHQHRPTFGGGFDRELRRPTDGTSLLRETDRGLGSRIPGAVTWHFREAHRKTQV